MFRTRFHVKHPEPAAGGGAAGGDDKGVLADAAARAAAAAANQVKPDDARAFLGNVVHDQQYLAGLKDEDVVTWHGKVKGYVDKTTQDALNAAAKASGEKPADVPDQFWDAEKKTVNFSAWNKSLNDTRQALKTAKGPDGKVPAKAEEYAYQRPADLPAHLLSDMEKDESLKVLRETALESGLTQEQFTKMANGYYARAAKLIPPPLDVKAEIAKLGNNGVKVADTVHNWGQALVAQGIWSKDEFTEVIELGASAVGMRALNKLREAMGGEQIPTTAGDVTGLPSEQELYAMVATEKYQKDPAERARVDALFEKVFGTQPAGTSKSGLGMVGRKAA